MAVKFPNSLPSVKNAFITLKSSVFISNSIDLLISWGERSNTSLEYFTPS